MIWFLKFFVISLKDSGGNPKATASHTAMNEAAGCLRDVTQDLLATMEEAASAAGAVTTMIDNISKAIAKVCLYQEFVFMV